MIGIINNELSAYSIIDRIRTYNKNLNIYLYKEKVNDYEEVIEKLINKNCEIIIIPSIDNIDNIKKKYNKVKFICLKEINIKDSIILDNKELIKAINLGNQNKVLDILKNLNINNKRIVINNPTLLFIKEILEKDYNCKIIDNIDYLIEEIDKNINKYNINTDLIGECFYIN